MGFSKKLQELMYSFSTNDRYSEYNPHQSFNRINRPDESNSSLLSESNASSLANDLDSDNVNKNNFDGVHETRLAWRHITNWLMKNHPDMNASLCSGCTDYDLKDFQSDLSIKLPNCILESFKRHDGQELLTGTTGLIFGLELMTLDDIGSMTENWRKVSSKVSQHTLQNKWAIESNNLEAPIKSHNNINNLKKLNGLNNDDPKISPKLHETQNEHHTQPQKQKMSNNMVPNQNSIPPNHIHAVYAHPMWIPLLTDRCGNHIGVDLSPAKEGKWGQIIMFGRDFDTKYKIADNWGDFLLIFANDLEIGNYRIIEDEDLYAGDGDLVFKDHSTGKELNYFGVLKERAIEKWKKLEFLKVRNDSLVTITEDSKKEDQYDDDVVEKTKENIKSEETKNSSLTVFDKLPNYQTDKFLNDNLNDLDTLNQPIVNQPQPLQRKLTNKNSNSENLKRLSKLKINSASNSSSSTFSSPSKSATIQSTLLPFNESKDAFLGKDELDEVEI